MNELALFAGAGGGILGGKLLGWQTVCAVEFNEHCRRVLMQRQCDGILKPFPIWDDVRTFDGKPWRGIVDVVSGGFPCQKFSNAHHGCATADDLWPEMLRIVDECRPGIVFAENVKEAPILSARRDIESLGFKCNHNRFDAHFAGAPHCRTRWWLAGNSYVRGESNGSLNAETSKLPRICGDIWSEENLAVALRMDDGLADRVERNRAIGNGQVPAVARLAWKVLTNGSTKDQH